MGEIKIIPIFPLDLVLFPNQELPLRIFEPRYKQMIDDCMLSNKEFGVCLINSEKTVSNWQAPHTIGTIAKIIDCNEIGQPILIFTSSINKSEIYSTLLKKKNINHIVLNAKNHENEAEIIANAGKEKSVIITTSISGRGVDIQLGGKKGSISEDQLQIDKDKIKSLGGLFVIGTKQYRYNNIELYAIK